MGPVSKGLGGARSSGVARDAGGSGDGHVAELVAGELRCGALLSWRGMACLLVVRWLSSVWSTVPRAACTACRPATRAFSPGLCGVGWPRGPMDFRILGPLEARNQCGEVELRGVKPRAVLA